MKTVELIGAALDWAVAQCEGVPLKHGLTDDERYSTNWAQGGPIIEREKICTLETGDAAKWKAYRWADDNFTPEQYGPTPLIAAMRCYVASTLGAEVDVPDLFGELK